MYLEVAFLVFFVNCASSRHAHAPHYADLDEDEQALFRAAYDSAPYGGSPYETPAYDHVEVADQDPGLSKLDLLKDVMWALKAKMQEIKAFHKAMAANLLASKLQLKDLKTLVQPLAHHHHKVIADKPTYSYQAPSQSYGSHEQAYPAPQQAHYDVPHAPQPYAPQHHAPQYGAPQYGAPQEQYGAPQQHQHDPYYGV